MECVNCHEKIGSERMLHGFYICSEDHIQCRECANKMCHQCPLCGVMELSECSFNIQPIKIDKSVSRISVEMLRRPTNQTTFLYEKPQESISAEILFMSEQNKLKYQSIARNSISNPAKLLEDNPVTHKNTTTASRAETVCITDDGKIIKEDLEFKKLSPDVNFSHQKDSSNGRTMQMQCNKCNPEPFLDKDSVQYSSYTFGQPQLQPEWHKEKSYLEIIPHDIETSPLSFKPFYEEIRIIEEPMVQEQLPLPDQFSWQRVEEFIKQEISQHIREFFKSDNCIESFKKTDLNKNKVTEDDQEKTNIACSTISEPCLQIFEVHVPHKYNILTETHKPDPKNPVSFKTNMLYDDQQMKLLKAYRESSLPLDVDKPDIAHWWGGHIPTAPEADIESEMEKGKIMPNNEKIESIVKKKIKEQMNIPQHDIRVVINKSDGIENDVLCKPDELNNDSSEIAGFNCCIGDASAAHILTSRLRSNLELDKSRLKMKEDLKKEAINAKLQSKLKSMTWEDDKNLLGGRTMLGEFDLLKKHKQKRESNKLPTMFRVLYNPMGVLLCPIHAINPCTNCPFNGFGFPPMSQPTISLANTKYYKFEVPQILQMKHSSFSHDPIYCPDALCRRSFLPTDCSKHYIIEHHNQPLFDIRIGQRINFKLNPSPSQSNYACSQLLFLISDRIREFGRSQYQNSMPLLLMTAKIKLTYLLGYQSCESSRLIENDEDYLLIWILGIVTPELRSTYTFTTWRYRKEKPLCHISQTLNVLDIRERQIPINIYHNADGLLLTPQELYLLTDSHKESLQCQLEVH